MATGLDIQGLDTAVDFYFQNSLHVNRIHQPKNVTYLFALLSPSYSLNLNYAVSCQPRLWKNSLIPKSNATCQIAQGFPDPEMTNMARLEGVTRSIKMSQAKRAVKVPKRLPITLAILKGFWHYLRDFSLTWYGHPPHQLMIWAAACICYSFYGFFRAREITVPLDAAFDPMGHYVF